MPKNLINSILFVGIGNFAIASTSPQQFQEHSEKLLRVAQEIMLTMDDKTDLLKFKTPIKRVSYPLIHTCATTE